MAADGLAGRRPMRLIARVALALLAGAVAILGMAPFNIWPVPILALAVLFVLLDGAAETRRPIWTASLTGWAFGFAYFAGGFYWVGEAFYVDPDTIWLMPFAVTLLPAGMAIYLGVAGGITQAIGRRGAANALIMAAAFSACEFLRGFLFTGFPWNLFGSTFIDSAIGQGAAIGGVYGLTFAVFLAGFALPPLVRGRGPARYIPALIAVTLIGGSFGYGVMRPGPDLPAAPLRVRLVQPDNPQSEKSRPDYARRLWLKLIALTTQPGDKPVDIIIWPEGVTPFFLDEATQALAVIGETLGPQQTLVAGSARREIGTDGTTRYFNSMFVIGAGGRIEKVYDKAHLVPFGEFLPVPGFFRMLDIASLTARIGGSFTSGRGLTTLAPAGLPPFGALICYEVLFSGEAVDAAHRPLWIVNITDDSWFGTGIGPYQHLTAVRFRAIEEGLPIARAATTGVSAMVDARGAVLASIPLQVSQAIDLDLPPSYSGTIFSRFGNGLFWVLTAVAFALGLLLDRRKSSGNYH